jgi:hypothetical protein
VGVPDRFDSTGGDFESFGGDSRGLDEFLDVLDERGSRELGDLDLTGSEV